MALSRISGQTIQPGCLFHQRPTRERLNQIVGYLGVMCNGRWVVRGRISATFGMD